MNQTDLKYYRNERRPLSQHIAAGSRRVLDVGCGAGNFGNYLKGSGKAREVFGIELMPHAAEEARNHLDDVVCGDLDALSLADLRLRWAEPFDYVVCGDVLEHLKNPWHTLGELVAFLAPDGRAIVSLPNVRHWKVVSALLLKGQWTYRDSGIMDRTHLRFFTRSSARELLESAGLQVEAVQPLIGGKWRLLSRFTGRLFDEFLAVQYVLVARRKP